MPFYPVNLYGQIRFEGRQNCCRDYVLRQCYAHENHRYMEAVPSVRLAAFLPVLLVGVCICIYHIQISYKGVCQSGKRLSCWLTSCLMSVHRADKSMRRAYIIALWNNLQVKRGLRKHQIRELLCTHSCALGFPGILVYPKFTQVNSQNTLDKVDQIVLAQR